MRVLLVTSTARGHAIAEAIARSAMAREIISVCTQRNPGIAKLATEQHVVDIMNFPAVMDIAKKTKPDLAVIGPDDPIGAGLADELEAIGIPTVAPLKELAKIESSKGFARELMRKFGIDASPRFKVFEPQHKSEELNKFIVQELGGNFVVKYDALRGGKGVKVSGEHVKTVEEGVQYAKECIDECGRVVIEEKLIGCEFSLLSFVSGEQVIHMPLVVDHKRAYEGDTGPNTGGMGTYTDANHTLPFLTEQDVKGSQQINRDVALALVKECGKPYKGILYGGFIAVKDGVRVIEYNARFGDPEALNLLPLLKTDFMKVCLGIIEGTLTDALVEFEKQATVCKYITPRSYPEGKNERGQSVEFPKNIPENARIFYGDIAHAQDGSLILGGSRTAGIVGIGETIEEAEQIAESLCERVKGPVRFRRDIGTKALIDQRVQFMREVRST